MKNCRRRSGLLKTKDQMTEGTSIEEGIWVSGASRLNRGYLEERIEETLMGGGERSGEDGAFETLQGGSTKWLQRAGRSP